MNITHYDVAIIGGGVAGMTAALYLKRANISCCIFEKNIPGGIINYTDQIEKLSKLSKYFRRRSCL